MKVSSFRRYRRKITDYIAISKPIYPDKRCIFCGEKLLSIGLICYSAHPTFKTYNWVHLECLTPTLKPDQMTPNIKKLFLYYPPGPDSEPIFKNTVHTTKAACSYCGLLTPSVMYRFHGFNLHPHCVPELYKKTKEVFMENASTFAAAIL